jgi:hypothetical protein
MNNYMDESDLWDITTYDFDDSSYPCNATWYDGKPSGCAIYDFSAKGSIMTMKISMNFTVENLPPADLTITGPSSGKPGILYNYSFVASDPEQQYIHYYIDWGDESSTDWIGPKKSGSTQKIDHSWAKKGTYSVRIKAKDLFGAESDWVTLSVKIPCSYNIPFQPFWERLFERFPHAFPLLRHLMGY